MRRKRTTVTYGAAMAVDCATTRIAVITASDGVAFTVTHTHAKPGYRLTLEVRNSSGGVLGAPTLTGFSLGSAFTKPADGKMRRYTFGLVNGTFVEVHRSPVDLAFTTIGVM
jgi:hypothetical protein